MEASSNVTPVSDDQVTAVSRLERQCRKRFNNTYIETEEEEFDDVSHSDELLLKEDVFKVPIVQKKAIDNDLNFPKQYKRLVEWTEREVYMIHNKEPGCKNKNIKGSIMDKKQVLYPG